LILIIVLVIYGFFGVNFINEQERGVVLRLGKYHRTLGPGLNWVPPILDKISVVNVTQVREHPSHGAMLTQDLNIVEVDLSVQFSVENAENFVLKVRDPVNSLEQATDSALRHVIGSAEMHDVLTEGRSQIAIDVRARLQEYLNYYETGIRVEKVNIESTSPPKAVQEAFDDVNRAREDEERVKNEAQADVNRIIPEARGSAQRVIEEANGYREQVVAEAQGEADRFEKLLTEYKKAPKVTRERLYLETVQQVMANSTKIMIDVEGGSNLLYLPLDKIVQQSGSIPASGASTANWQDIQTEIDNAVRRAVTTQRRDGGR
jgi:membrane protease subunit HflK